LTVKGDPPRTDLLGTLLHQLIDAVVNLLHDPTVERFPGVAGQKRRDVDLVNLWHRLGLRGSLDAGDRQYLVTGRVLRRVEQADVEPAILDGAGVLAGVLIEDAVARRVGAIANAVIRGTADVGPAELHDRHREAQLQRRLPFNRLTHVEWGEVAVLRDAQERAVAQPGLEVRHDDAVIAQGVGVNLDGPQAPVVMRIPL
jgi:hypothetical protein